MSDSPTIIVVTGIQASGKSTVSRALAARFERGAFIEADALQRMIVSGGQWVSEIGDPEGEVAVQLRLRLKNACLLARSFQAAGFTAVLDDIIIGDRFDHLREYLAGCPFHFVVLAPDVAAVKRRDAARDKRVGEDWAEYLDAELRRTIAGIGLWVDSTSQSVEETVDEILRRMPDEGLIES
jgi:chloramphenicol 3-O-phosphotransferase